MKITISCGGTGGHMYPGLAVAAEAIRRGHKTAVILSGRSVENADRGAALPPGAVALHVPSRPFSLKKPLSLLVLARNVLLARRTFRAFRPDVLLAMGSYTCAAPVLAARWAGIPVVLHEANAVPGDAIAKLARLAKAVCTCFPGMERHFRPGTALFDTGLPLRSGIAPASASTRSPRARAAAQGTPPATPPPVSLLIMGGSQGADGLNRGIVAAFAAALSNRPSAQPPTALRIVHLAGPGRKDEVQNLWKATKLENRGVEIETVDYENDMARRYAEADFCICRAGAASSFELALSGLPAAFVPLPKVAHEHQTRNAEAFVAAGAALMLPQDALFDPVRGPAAIDAIFAKIRSSQALDAMRNAMLSLARPDAAGRVTDVLLQAAGTTHPLPSDPPSHLHV